MTRTRLAALLPVVLVAAVLAGCAARVPHIGDLKSNPSRYHDKTISVEGVVTSSWGVPLLPMRLYRIDDGTGELTIISQNQRTPMKGARVRVKGRVSEVAVFGGQPLGLHVREQDLDMLDR